MGTANDVENILTWAHGIAKTQCWWNKNHEGDSNTFNGRIKFEQGRQNDFSASEESKSLPSLVMRGDC